MKISKEKYRAPNYGRVLVSLFVIYLFKHLSLESFLINCIAYIYFSLSAIWIFLIETELIIERKNNNTSFFPVFLDLFAVTILVTITGNIHSFFSCGYIALTAVSSQNIEPRYGIFSLISSLLLFCSMGLLVYFGFVPNLNILSSTSTTPSLTAFTFSTGVFAVSLFIVNSISRKFMKKNKDLNQMLLGQKKKLEKYLLEYKKDLDLAKKIQRSLITNLSTNASQLEIKTRFAPMNEVGGDIYDICELNNGLVRIFLADATGHGVQAALITMAIKSEYENLKRVVDSPGELLSMMNSYFISKYKIIKAYFSCVIADIYLDENKIQYSSAGHPSQIYFVNNQIHKLETSSRIIGLHEKSTYPTKTFTYETPCRFLFFTDGIFESFSNDIDPFGEDSFYIYLYDNPDFNTDKLTKKIETKKSISEQKDDITLISVKLSK
jgi:serine phosphatase RsbU (regulator of sigma subunit)